MNGKGSGSSHDNSLANGVSSLRLGSDAVPVMTDSPSDSPTSTTHVAGVNGVNGHMDPSRELSRDIPAGGFDVPGPREGLPQRKRTPSMWSQWELEDAAEESSDDDEDAFLTPSEGLSEVEEEDEDGDGTAEVDRNLDKTNVTKGAMAVTGDISGTGKSTIKRTRAKEGTTHVRKREVTTRSSALAVDQAAVLSTDLDICRQVLSLFLTSKMKEAEDLCFEKDPDANHLYLLSAHGIINGLKVRL